MNKKQKKARRKKLNIQRKINRKNKWGKCSKLVRCKGCIQVIPKHDQNMRKAGWYKDGLVCKVCRNNLNDMRYIETRARQQSLSNTIEMGCGSVYFPILQTLMPAIGAPIIDTIIGDSLNELGLLD